MTSSSSSEGAFSARQASGSENGGSAMMPVLGERGGTAKMCVDRKSAIGERGRRRDLMEFDHAQQDLGDRNNRGGGRARFQWICTCDHGVGARCRIASRGRAHAGG